MTEKILRDIIQNEGYGSVESFEDVSGLNKITYSVELDSGRELIVSWIDDEEKVEDFKIEADVIELINMKTDIAVPEIITENFSDKELPPYYLMEKIDGYNPDDRFKYMPENVKKNLLKEAGRILGKLHAETEFDSVGNFYYTEKGLKLREKKVWSDTLFDSMGHHLTGLENTFFEPVIEEAENAFEKHKHLLDDIEFEPVLVHEDFRPGNLIIKDNEIEAVIDWERALVGHNEYDLFKAERDFIDLKFKTENIREKYRGYLLEGYREVRELEEGWEQRREFYRFIHIIQDLRVFADNHKEWMDNPKETEEVVEHFKQKLRDQIKELENMEE
jgi:aminoglycoside phosphotransferase (APT) family kinase protein